MNAPVTYIPNFLPDPDQVLFDLSTWVQWDHRGKTPRLEYYCNDLNKPYVYGTGPRRKEYRPGIKTGTLRHLQILVEQWVGCRLEVCFLNRYRDGSDHVSWHADDEPEMDASRPIAAISLGAPRAIRFRPIVGSRCACGSESDVHAEGCLRGVRRTLYGRSETLIPAHGSLYIMAAGMQQTWHHCVVKRSTQQGERISVTFRGYREVA